MIVNKSCKLVFLIFTTKNLHNLFTNVMKHLTASLLLLVSFSSVLNCQTESLILYYPFDDIESIIIPDESGNGINGYGIYVLSASDRFGRENSALQFNGHSSYIEFEGDSVALPEYSYSAWIKVLEPPYFDSAGFIIDVGSQYGVDQFIAYTNSYSNYDLDGLLAQGYHNEGGSAWFSQYDFLEPDVWKFLVMTRSRNYFSFYIDGILVNSKNISNLTPSYGDDPLGRIGCRNTMHQYFNGYIDDVRIFNYAIDSATIDSLLNLSITDLDAGGEMLSCRIFPNPTCDYLEVELPDNSTSCAINVFDHMGRLIVNQKNKTQVDARYYARGMYFIRVQDLTNSKLYFYKFVKN